MKTMASIISALALVSNVLASPIKEISARGDPSQVLLCSGSNGSGNCVKWEMQTGHYWDFDDEGLAPVRGGLTSIYPQDDTHKWSICSGSNGGGYCVNNIVAPGIDNLADFNFNDQAYSISPAVL